MVQRWSAVAVDADVGFGREGDAEHEAGCRAWPGRVGGGLCASSSLVVEFVVEFVVECRSSGWSGGGWDWPVSYHQRLWGPQARRPLSEVVARRGSMG